MFRNVGPLNVLICDSSLPDAERLKTELHRNPLTKEHIALVEIVYSLGEAMTYMDNVEIDMVYIDVFALGVEQSSRFIFDIRKRRPRVVFALYIDLKHAQRQKEFYKGDRVRFRHYFELNKATDHGTFPDRVTKTLYLGMSDIRLQTSFIRTTWGGPTGPPPEITESLKAFYYDHPKNTGFVMMQFGDTKAHQRIHSAIEKAVSQFKGVEVVRADHKDYHVNLLFNVLTYAHGCRFGLAVFERIEEDRFNPNVALEVGYMLALNKPICYLKDKTLHTLPTDLVGQLYRPFDPQSPEKSIAAAVGAWITDRAFA